MADGAALSLPAPPGALDPLVAALRVMGIPAAAVSGRWAVRLTPAGAAWSLAALGAPPVPVAQDPHRYRPIVELCRLAQAGHPPPFHPTLRSAAVMATEAVEAGTAIDAPPAYPRIGPRLAIEPTLRLGAGRVSALPLLQLCGQPMAAALGAWAQRRPALEADDPAGLLLATPSPDLLRIGARLRRTTATDPASLVQACLVPAVEDAGRRVGSGLLHVHLDALSVRPWRGADDTALRHALATAERDEDIHDHEHGRERWAAADPLGRAWPALRPVTGPRGQPLTVTDWPAGPAVLPAADLYDLHNAEGEVIRVWADAILDVFDAVSQPIPHAWPPRFAVAGPLPPAALPRARAQALPRA